MLLVGVTPASIPTALGGTLDLVPIWSAIVPLPKYSLTVPVAIPCSYALVGQSVDLQALEQDPGASLGVAFTPGLQLTFGS